MLESAGIFPAAIVAIASSNAARSIGLDDEVGTVTPGKSADFILLDTDPAAGAHAFLTVREVYRKGAMLHGAAKDQD